MRRMLARYCEMVLSTVFSSLRGMVSTGWFVRDEVNASWLWSELSWARRGEVRRGCGVTNQCLLLVPLFTK